MVAKPQSPALEIEMVAPGSITPDKRNSRTHSPEQIQQIAASIAEFGFVNPILVDADGGIIAGHGRLAAAKTLKSKKVPVIRLGHLTATQKRALLIADNQLAANAGWDMDALRDELTALKDVDFDINLVGFDGDQLAVIFTPPNSGLADPDAAPEPEDDATAVLGDLWHLGRHLLVCGDSTDEATVLMALNGAKPHLMVTDPPYGVNYDPNWRNRTQRSDGTVIGASAIAVVHNDDRADWREAWALFPGDAAYVWHGGLVVGVVGESLTAAGFELRTQIIWAKSNMAIGRGNYHWKHEPCWYAVRKGRKGHWNGSRKETTVWDIDKPMKSETGHSTQKPVECMRRPIENNSKAGDGIYEPFSGSGTTIIAAEQTGRVCHAIELHPSYIDVAIKRWEAFTGEKATLNGTGKTFSEVATEREAVRDAA